MHLPVISPTLCKRIATKQAMNNLRLLTAFTVSTAIGLLGFTGNAHAIFMRGATDVRTNLGAANLPSNGDPLSVGGTGAGNLTNQSGLTQTYSNGQSQSAYLGSNPTHDWKAAGQEWFSAPLKTFAEIGLPNVPNFDGGYLDFDLGGVFKLKNVVLWNEDIAGIDGFRIFKIDGLGDQNDGTDIGLYGNRGNYSADRSAYHTNHVAQVFDVKPTETQYVRLFIDSVYFPNQNQPPYKPFKKPYASAGEVAFGVDSKEAIPTPAMLPGVIGMGLTAWRKRRQANAQAKA
jgi:hypothetical protein